MSVCSRRGCLTVCAFALAVSAFVAVGASERARLQTQAPSARPAARVISLVPALTEMIFAFGAGPQVVAVSSFDQDPPQVRDLPRVGALLDPDVERIITLRPDLVLVYGSQLDLMTQLQRASIPYYDYRHGGLGGVTATIRALGLRLGRVEQSTTLAMSIEQRLAALRKRTAGLLRPKTLLVFGRESGTLRNVYASGGRGFLHEMLLAAGGSNVLADVAAESLQMSSEQILARAPDVILEIRSDGSAAISDPVAEMSAWNALASIPAVRNNRLHLLAGRHHVVPGPRVAESAEAMAAVLHSGPAKAVGRP